jgi:hypothetical protein
MSELKGQLLGMLMVLAIFAAIGSILYGAFKKTANNISNEMTNAETVLASSSSIA